ncbi:EamA-like transporter family protein [Tistlia consotensis]|uniref:EamA-like transporter family protein n=1 Tax=Tistlia consotensis USBA 355 TaxID=560819 RepID=A0A1Y6CV76_9PROT|nr:DMT family transporter [Tistlia consotensis]SMF79573.1 EamA-like transporter family protein [Tistlia consotensis USBA 355]SNS16904.1 EamA-like transporter family protein [Tistlia consotensis]
MQGSRFGLGALLFVVLAWGTPVPFMTLLLERWDPMQVAVSRYLFALPLLLLLLLWREPPLRWTGALRPQGVGWRSLAELGFAMAGFSCCFVLGLAATDPVTAAILSAAAPIIGALLDRLLHGQRLAPGLGLAMILSVPGAALVGIDFGHLDDGLAFGGGEPLILLALLFWAWYSIAVARRLGGVSRLRATTLTILPAVLWLLAAYLAADAAGLVAPLPSDPPLLDLALMVWISASGVTLGVVAWHLGVQQFGIVVASLYLNLIPIAATVTAALLGLPPRWEQVAGGLLVVAGVAQAQLRNLRRRRAEAAAADAAAR